MGETTPGPMLDVVLSSSELCEAVRRRDTRLNTKLRLPRGFPVLLCGTYVCAMNIHKPQYNVILSKPSERARLLLKLSENHTIVGISQYYIIIQ